MWNKKESSEAQEAVRRALGFLLPVHSIEAVINAQLPRALVLEHDHHLILSQMCIAGEQDTIRAGVAERLLLHAIVEHLSFSIGVSHVLHVGAWLIERLMTE